MPLEASAFATLSACLETSQILAGEVVLEVGHSGFWQPKPEGKTQVQGSQASICVTSWLTLLVVRVSHAPEYAQGPCLASVITVPIIVISIVVIIGSTY